jgi:hypothetical protein
MVPSYIASFVFCYSLLLSTTVAAARMPLLGMDVHGDGLGVHAIMPINGTPLQRRSVRRQVRRARV